MTSSTTEARQAPNALVATACLLPGLPLGIVWFVLTVLLLVVGVGTAVVWVGLPIFAFALLTARRAAELERRRARAVGVLIPSPYLPIPDDTLVRRWWARTTDSATWRDVLYLVLLFPVGIIEFVFTVALWLLTLVAILIPVVGVALARLPRGLIRGLGLAHGLFAESLLGPTRASLLSARAERLQASRARGVDAAEAERRRIERDLHDGAQQRLVAVAMGLGRARAKLEAEPEAARALINEAHADAKLAIAELRDLARGIYPSVLGDRGLDAALSSLAAKCPIPVEVTVEVEPRPPAAVESTAYFTVGEALTNVAKYSGATRAEVTVRRVEDKVIVEVTDDGQGGASAKPGGGLAGLADRAATIDGVLVVLSPLGGPTVIRAELPCVW
ncbi:sensor histidine kinase [Solihabitans fulvus]|uniref:histidine kinase n=1 Tax=Solihabitans fulvus TaxID=1892852 RepID=A0A5B2XJ45_9PSEU|nr:sensor histidine kinase [Solihabitans fulvus]KAA2262840.1 sensor histidine kinase [Solihabitans fulvus]